MRIGVIPDFDSEIDLVRLKEAILYVSRLGEGDPMFGAIKLNKVLFYADFQAHREAGESITGATYQHLSEGPAPKELLAAMEELQHEGRIRSEEKPYYNRTQKRPVTQADPDVNIFTPSQLEMLDRAFESLLFLNARQVSDLSHQEWGWRLTVPGEAIPYRTCWLSPDPLTQEQVRGAVVQWRETCG